MTGVETRAYQLHLGETVPETAYQFYGGTVIFPLYSSQGVLRNTITAEITQMRRGKLTVYKSLTRIDLYHGGFWSLPEGAFFAAYRKNRHDMK